MVCSASTRPSSAVSSTSSRRSAGVERPWLTKRRGEPERWEGGKKPGENYGKTMGILWQSMVKTWGKLVGVSGDLWELHGKIYGNPWESGKSVKKSMEKLWKSHLGYRKSNENRKSTAIHIPYGETGIFHDRTNLSICHQLRWKRCILIRLDLAMTKN